MVQPEQDLYLNSWNVMTQGPLISCSHGLVSEHPMMSKSGHKELAAPGERMAIANVLKCHAIDDFIMHLAEMRGRSTGYTGPIFCRSGVISGHLDVLALKSLEMGCGIQMLSILAKYNTILGSIRWIRFL